MNKIKDLDTPALLVREALLVRNIEDMAYFAKNAKVNLRPHIKAHKLPPIAKAQIATGASGITVAKLGEAEVMVEAGIKDILIAYPLIGEEKMKRLMTLLDYADITVTVDSIVGAEILDEACKKHNKQLKILIEVNTGLDRCGTLPGEDTLELAQQIIGLSNLKFIGIMTHAGEVYGAKTRDQVVDIGKAEGTEMVRTAELLRAHGIEVQVISVGSTPTAKIAGMVEGVTEIRPGNYVFYDAIQIGLGAAVEEDCSLSVLATVVSKPAADRIIIDAGSKALGLDKGAHGNDLLKGFGIIKKHSDIIIERLSEEHGILKTLPDCSLKIGDKIEIIPNHACVVINLFDEANLIRNEEVKERWRIKGRGKTS